MVASELRRCKSVKEASMLMKKDIQLMTLMGLQDCRINIEDDMGIDDIGNFMFSDKTTDLIEAHTKMDVTNLDIPFACHGIVINSLIGDDINIKLNSYALYIVNREFENKNLTISLDCVFGANERRAVNIDFIGIENSAISMNINSDNKCVVLFRSSPLYKMSTNGNVVIKGSKKIGVTLTDGETAFINRHLDGIRMYEKRISIKEIDVFDTMFSMIVETSTGRGFGVELPFVEGDYRKGEEIFNKIAYSSVKI